MPTVSANILIFIPVEKVWETIAGFGSLAQWCSSVKTCQLSHDGLFRYLQTRDGANVVERLRSFSQDDRTYSYTITAAPFWLQCYEATLSVLPSGIDATRVIWSCTFQAEQAQSENLAETFEKLFQEGLQDLSDLLEPPQRY